MRTQFPRCSGAKLMISTLALALMACGGDDGPAPALSSGGSPATSAPTPTPSAMATSAPAPTPSPSTTPTPSPTPTGGASGTASVQDALMQVMLAEHNAARRAVGTPDLVIDPDLNRQALEYAQQLARTGTFQHSPNSARPNQGENLWAGTASRFTHEQQAGAWINEDQYYIHDRFPFVSNTGRWQDVGHYTQIIWRDTKRLGCGIATGGGRDYVVCRYSPAGNFIGEFAY